MNPLTFIFIGRSGCGKGTQADFLVEKLTSHTKSKDSIFRLETGQTFRDLIAKEGYTNGIVRDLYEKGALMPQFLSIWVWADYCIKNLKQNQHMIFDGSPRRLEEAGVVETALDFYGRNEVHVIFLNVSEATVTKRLLARKRQDDTTDDIKARMQWYIKDVIPTVEYYRKSPRYHFHEIDGEKTPEQVRDAIMQALKLDIQP